MILPINNGELNISHNKTFYSLKKKEKKRKAK